jgi:serine/threonine protein kinase
LLISAKSHIFAVKTYQNKYRRTFDRELAAYTKLNYLDRNHHNILRCLGSFTQQSSGGPTYNLLLEYAECDLDEYFEHTLSPDSLESIRWLWEQLFGVADGLQTIHDGLGTGDQGRTYFGYHADLKPANILRVGSQWKIADFGFSKFVEAEDDQLPEQIMDGGTCMYST